MKLDLITSSEAAAIAGITPGTFRDLVTKRDRSKSPIPAPVIEGSRGRPALWDRATIIEWAATRDRSTGRARS